MTTSVVSFVVREGNPKNIKTWDDLLKPGVEVLTPNPFSSGAAKWNLLAGYGQASRRRQGPGGRSRLRPRADHRPREGAGQVRAARRCRTSSAATATCSSPTSTRRSPPTRTARSSSTSSPTTRSRSTSTSRRRRTRRPQAQSFLDYVLSKPAQEHFVDWGYRPVNEEVLAANKTQVPRPARPVHDRGPRRLGARSTRSSSTSRAARSPRSRRTRGCRPPSERDLRTPSPLAAPGRPAGRPRPRHRRRCG